MNLLPRSKGAQLPWLDMKRGRAAPATAQYRHGGSLGLQRCSLDGRTASSGQSHGWEASGAVRVGRAAPANGFNPWNSTVEDEILTVPRFFCVLLLESSAPSLTVCSKKHTRLR